MIYNNWHLTSMTFHFSLVEAPVKLDINKISSVCLFFIYRDVITQWDSRHAYCLWNTVNIIRREILRLYYADWKLGVPTLFPLGLSIFKSAKFSTNDIRDVISKSSNIFQRIIEGSCILVLYFKTSEIDLDRGYLRQNLCSMLARSLTTKSNEEFLRVCLDSSTS